MSETKTFVLPEAASTGSGFDPNLFAALMNNGGFGGNGNNWIWIFFLFILFGWGGNGMFGNGSGLANQINNDYGRELLSQAINGNRIAISELASNLNCDVNSIQTALSGLNSSIQNVGNTVGMSSQGIINAIQSGNMSIASQLAQCCCENKQLLLTQGYENQIATLNQTNQLGSKMDANANTITAAIANQTTLLNDRFCELEIRELQDKITGLREDNLSLRGQLDNINQTNTFAAMINSAVTPINASIASLTTIVNDIRNAAPATVTVPAENGVYLPAAAAAQLGLYGKLPTANSTTNA